MYPHLKDEGNQAEANGSRGTQTIGCLLVSDWANRSRLSKTRKRYVKHAIQWKTPGVFGRFRWEKTRQTLDGFLMVSHFHVNLPLA